MEEMLLHSSNIEAATAEIKSAGGRVTMQLGDELLKFPVTSSLKRTVLHRLQLTLPNKHRQKH